VETRERLIETTQGLLWERGYVGTSPRAIQERASVGQGSMYHHFTGKADLALAAIKRTAEQMDAGTAQWLTEPGAPLERLRRLLGRERPVMKGCRIGGLTQDPEIVASDELRAPLAETFRRHQARTAEVISEGIKTGDLPATTDPDDLAATIAAVIQGGYVLARAEGNTEPYQRALRGLMTLLESKSPAGDLGHGA
jgi:TetR/AcrR family transcriptional repressor of nem operon